MTTKPTVSGRAGKLMWAVVDADGAYESVGFTRSAAKIGAGVHIHWRWFYRVAGYRCIRVRVTGIRVVEVRSKRKATR